MLYAFSFGGFLFYAGVVVPIGSRVVGVTTQGFVTQQVTQVLNWSVLALVLALTAELVFPSRQRARRGTKLLLLLTVALAACCLGLMLLHARMDLMLNAEQLAVEAPKQFYSLHRIYLWISTLQWLCSLPVLWIVLNCDRKVD